MSFFKFNIGKPKTRLGVDIGTASIKIVEVEKDSGRLNLVNYGMFELENINEAIQTQQKSQKLDDQDIVWGIQETIRRSKILGKDAVASIPSFSTFATVISMPYISKDDIARAIPFEARKYIPIPIDEVAYEWSIVDLGSGYGLPGQSQVNSSKPPVVEVFLAAVPKDEIRRYQFIMKNAGLNLRALELENMSLIRALIGNDKSPFAMVNIGGRSTAISVVDGGVERISRNFELGGFEITKSIARSLDVGLKRAEELKRSIGFKETDAKIINEAMTSLVDTMIFEARKTISKYEIEKKTKISKVILTGGLTNMPNFSKYFKDKIGMEVSVGSPFSRLAYNERLGPIIDNLGTIFSVAIGLAMRDV